MNKTKFNKLISSILIISQLVLLFSCSKPFTDDNVLCKYDELNCLYYSKDEIKKFKYSDYIFDDVSSGLYIKSTPALADYKTGNGMLDYDIGAYVDARMSYALKVELIKKHQHEMDLICAKVHEDYFEQRNSYIYFYDNKSNKSTLLYDGPVTNISYDDEVPTISFDTSVDDNVSSKNIEGRRIMLSDIIASNMTIDGYMKVILGTGKKRVKFFLNKQVDDNFIAPVSTKSNTNR